FTVHSGVRCLPGSHVGARGGGVEGGGQETREAGIDTHGQRDTVLCGRGGRQAERADRLREVSHRERDKAGAEQGVTPSDEREGGELISGNYSARIGPELCSSPRIIVPKRSLVGERGCRRLIRPVV